MLVRIMLIRLCGAEVPAVRRREPCVPIANRQIASSPIFNESFRLRNAARAIRRESKRTTHNEESGTFDNRSRATWIRKDGRHPRKIAWSKVDRNSRMPKKSSKDLAKLALPFLESSSPVRRSERALCRKSDSIYCLVTQEAR